ncbi:Fis family transcriptional regulator [Marinomonas dokdonensis]|uniref:Fis family transcriptional regulator n=1 Tax=Marinomonas dokdonensis TaxID=328224 RepID=UPI0040555951
MRKTDKKLEQQLQKALTQVCELALEHYEGFEWLTHRVNYKAFPNSLKIICVFDTKEQVQVFQQQEGPKALNAVIKAKLLSIDIALPKIDKHIVYDSEEQCRLSHDGNWAARLSASH